MAKSETKLFKLSAEGDFGKLENLLKVGANAHARNAKGPESPGRCWQKRQLLPYSQPGLAQAAGEREECAGEGYEKEEKIVFSFYEIVLSFT